MYEYKKNAIELGAMAELNVIGLTKFNKSPNYHVRTATISQFHIVSN